MRRPLRSTAITAASSLLRVAPPLDRASVLSASLVRLVPFPCHRDRRFPQFRVRARTELTLPLCRMPHGQYTGARHADPGRTSTPGFDIICLFSTTERQFTGVRLLDSHLMPIGIFSATLTTKAFDPSRLRWFATCSCKPIARGRLSSLTASLISYAACCGTLKFAYSLHVATVAIRANGCAFNLSRWRRGALVARKRDERNGSSRCSGAIHAGTLNRQRRQDQRRLASFTNPTYAPYMDAPLCQALFLRFWITG